ncbi:Uma2 family endonuclease [Pseudokineococcus sp. 5B2Z-1]|uniref:Uma2 family endonuclease n=1 Tax=Pseudokineococcus sp. 5B2Z-1 TaxID=3132744 RepID=UPI0030B257F1
MTAEAPARRLPEERPMSWDQYAALGDDARGEYVDGCLVVTPFPSRQHQNAARRLAGLLEQHLPGGHAVVTAWGWKPGADEWAPDVMVHPVTAEQVRFTGTPLLCVEVLSTNRGDDLVRKTSKYARAGLPQYWVLDPSEPSLRMYLLEDGAYRQVGVVTDRGGAPGWPGLVVDVGALLA